MAAGAPPTLPCTGTVVVLVDVPPDVVPLAVPLEAVPLEVLPDETDEPLVAALPVDVPVLPVEALVSPDAGSLDEPVAVELAAGEAVAVGTAELAAAAGVAVALDEVADCESVVAAALGVAVAVAAGVTAPWAVLTSVWLLDAMVSR